MRRFLPDTFTLLLVCTVILASLLPISGEPADWFGLATKIAIGLLFFLHGARLSRDVVVAGLLHWRLHIVILASTFVLFPLLGLAIGFLPPTLLPPALYTGILFLCVLPSTVQSSIAFTSMAGGNVPAAICAASASNIFGMFLTPLLVGLLFTAGGHGGFSFDALEQILLQLLAPFILGQILQPWIGNFIRARKTLLMPVDRGSILMVVYLAFSEAVTENIWSTFSIRDIAVVIVLDILLLAVVLIVTMYGSRLMGFSKQGRDRHHLLRLEEEPSQRRADGQRHLRRPGHRQYRPAFDAVSPDSADGLRRDRPEICRTQPPPGRCRRKCSRRYGSG